MVVIKKHQRLTRRLYPSRCKNQTAEANIVSVDERNDSYRPAGLSATHRCSTALHLAAQPSTILSYQPCATKETHDHETKGRGFSRGHPTTKMAKLTILLTMPFLPRISDTRPQHSRTCCGSFAASFKAATRRCPPQSRKRRTKSDGQPKKTTDTREIN